MAHFAQVKNGIVENIIVAETQEWCESNFGGEWLQTSYNTHGGVHDNGGKPLRKNYAGVGYSYNKELDAFIPPRPYPSWILNEETCLWENPIPQPKDGLYKWNEDKLNWETF